MAFGDMEEVIMLFLLVMVSGDDSHSPNINSNNPASIVF